MKRTLSVIALALVLALCFGLMAPAMADTAEPAFERDANGYPDLQGAVFEIWYLNRQSQAVTDLAEMENVKALEELLNCDIQFIHPPQGQEADHFSITMAGDTLPDMFFCGSIDAYYPGGVAMAYADEILYDYTDLINEVNTPNFCNLIANDDYMAAAVRDDQGRIIRLGAKISGSDEANFYYSGPVVRADYLDATGLDMPETIADWYEMLTTMKANGVEYPLLMSGATAPAQFANAWGIKTDYYIDAEGKIQFGPYQDVYKDYLAEMNKWYTEELFNQDYMNLTSTDHRSMIASDRAGSAMLHFYWWTSQYALTVEVESPEKALIGAQLPKLNESDPLTTLRDTTRGLGDFKYITVDAEDPLACMYLLDTLYYNEISEMMEKGIKGVAWDMVDGQPVNYNLADNDENVMSRGISEWHMYEDYDPDNILKYKYCNGGVPDALLQMAECPTTGSIPNAFLFYTAEEAELRSDISTDLSTYVNEMNLKFITGQTSLDEFDAYQEQLKAMGVEEMIATIQAAYDRYLTR